jgi:hypothetical protein
MTDVSELRRELLKTGKGDLAGFETGQVSC